MPISIVHTGTKQRQTYNTSSTLSWALDQNPVAGNALIVFYAYQDPLSDTAPTPSIADSQGNTWVTLSVKNQSAGSANQSIAACIFYCASVKTSGADTITITAASNSGRSTVTANHIEVANLATSASDQQQTYSSGASAVTGATITANAANALADELVCAMIVGTNTTSFLTIGNASSGYTLVYNYGTTSNTTAVVTDADEKLPGAVETSSASWSGWGASLFACGLLWTFKGIASVAPSADYYLSNDEYH